MGSTPWVSQLDEFLSVDDSGILNGVSMTRLKTISGNFSTSNNHPIVINGFVDDLEEL